MNDLYRMRIEDGNGQGPLFLVDGEKTGRYPSKVLAWFSTRDERVDLDTVKRAIKCAMINGGCNLTWDAEKQIFRAVVPEPGEFRPVPAPQPAEPAPQGPSAEILPFTRKPT